MKPPTPWLAAVASAARGHWGLLSIPVVVRICRRTVCCTAVPLHLPEVAPGLGFVALVAQALPIGIGVGAALEQRDDVVELRGHVDAALPLTHHAERMQLEVQLADALQLPASDALVGGVHDVRKRKTRH